MKLADLKRISALVSIRRLAIACGFEAIATRQRIRRGQPELSEAEAKRIVNVLEESGLLYHRQTAQSPRLFRHVEFMGNDLWLDERAHDALLSLVENAGNTIYPTSKEVAKQPELVTSVKFLEDIDVDPDDFVAFGAGIEGDCMAVEITLVDGTRIQYATSEWGHIRVVPKAP